jgi:sodium-dependent dicarboxylate transporter 2/3/5
MSTAEAIAPQKLDLKRLFFVLLGVCLFVIVYFSPAWPDAIDPMGKHFVLSREGKGALAVFLLAGVWWVFEVVPIGVTSLMIGILQALFFIRKPDVAFKDFMDPSVLFIFGSIVIGLVFTKTGLTKRMAYKMLVIVGERTGMIMLGCFIVTVLLTHLMAHTAVAATMFPLFMTIYSLYDEEMKPSKFGKAMFIGLAYVCGAGSIITLLGAARGIVALGFYKELAGKEVSFFEFTYYFAPIGWVMALLLWGFFMIVLKPEKPVIHGLREKAATLYKALGPVTSKEIIAAVLIGGVIVFMSLQSFIPTIKPLNKSAIMLICTVLFFLFNILDIKDLEDIPWNIILLFSGAMSIGFCLWETEAAKWLAVNWLAMFKEANWFIFVMGVAFFVLVMTNFIMNVAAIAISLPVALVLCPYLGVAPEVILYASLVCAGMPFLLLVGAAPNAIAYNSRLFTSGEFFRYGLIASVLLLAVLALFITVIWPIMGMPVTLAN